jgi:amino acid transporter
MHPTKPAEPSLERGLGPWQATALNIANMIGIGPFITIPAFLATMGGPQAMIGWVVGAVLVICDGLVWSELGAALPGSGGTYHFLREIFGRYRWGRLMPFLFIWQFLVSGALEMASGYVGALQYLEYAAPGLAEFATRYSIPGGTKWIAAISVLVVTGLLCQRIKEIGWLSLVLCTGTLITVAIVIFAGLTNFNAELLRPPPGAFVLDKNFATGLGGAMLIAIYDYLGYFNICHLGDEVRQPERTIPRAVLVSVVVVAAIYLTMNVSIIAVVPWREAMASKNIAALFMERLYGPRVAVIFTAFILWTSLACVFAATLGYSRIPYAAARQGDFFKIFAWLHPTDHYPLVSLLVFGLLTAAFCFLDLGTIISAAVCVRIGVQFIGQIAGLHLLRTTRPDVKLPFRMWLYPLPSLVALAGWLYVLAMADRFVLLVSAHVLIWGVWVFVIRTIFAPSEQTRQMAE